MSETEDISDGKPHSVKNESLDADQLQEYYNLLKEMAQFYREENIRFEEMLKKLKILSDDGKLIGLGTSLENLGKTIAELEAKSLSLEKVELGHAEKLRERKDYASKLKICIRHYTNLNENISKKIGSLKSDLEHAKQDVNCSLKVDPQDIHQLEEKAKKYENELAKFENKNLWLKNPDYDLPNIGRHIDTLKSLKEEGDNLLEELSVYQNLKPDIKEAKQQLAELKEDVKSALVNFKV